jgi:hypothetical protein
MVGPLGSWRNPVGFSARLFWRAGVQNGEFETCPDWVPGMDTGQRLAPINLKTLRVHGLDHSANWAAKVRNVSRLGSQNTYWPRRARTIIDIVPGISNSRLTSSRHGRPLVYSDLSGSI